ncbi:transketolase [Limnoglobus roseus]|uniref:Transketolase n=1 Tax=Limnoglobus roseus TaxID=2598579 RepID=A0A5C1AEC5_9BACT|nr:transketolase [Limnoglobus roseus]
MSATPAKTDFDAVDQLCVNTIRTLSMDAVQKANSGHPGAPMGLAPVAYAVWNRFMTYDPADPLWFNRDRFVLSNGHASMLLYSMLHLAGVVESDGRKPVTIDEIKRFRQLNGVTPGHPETHLTSGVETTTGPLGQGIGNAVGMAIAQKWLAATYGKPGYEDLFAHRVYAICGDGCMMEGVASEASSLAGHLQLDNLVLLYDDNNITIDGRTTLAFTEDVYGRYKAYGWNVLKVEDGNTDLAAIAKALNSAAETKGKPTLIGVKTKIGFGAPHKQDTEHAHGEPLGDEEIKAAKKSYGWPEDKSFYVPDGVYDQFKANIGKRGADANAAWKAKFAEYKKAHADLATQVECIQNKELPAGWDKSLPVFPADPKGMATRDSSGKVLNAVAKAIPWMVGGSADLAKSNKSRLTFEGAGDFLAATPAGRNVNFGVREHGMGAICNGMALNGLRSFAAGFLIFSDYGRAAIRLASIIERPVVYVFTHDSIGVGEDGPTHQPIEQIASLRAIPGLIVLRPGDANEVTEAYRVAAESKHHPIILALSRQPVPTYDRTKFGAASGVAKGGYVLADAEGGKPDILLIATGTELPLAVEAYEKLTAEGVKARVVSLPSWELFEQQTQEYRDSVIPPSVTARVCIEMLSTFGWEHYAGPKGAIIGMRSFGASAPLKDLLKHFGFTIEKVMEAAKAQLKK